MALKEKSPPSAGTEERGILIDRGDRKTLTERLQKYASRKRKGCQIGAALCDVILVPKLGNKVLACGRYLAFRKFHETGQADLLSGNFCNQHLLCVACAAARASRLWTKWQPIIQAFPENDLYMLNLTWPPPDAKLASAAGPCAELKANIAIGLAGWGKLWGNRKKHRRGPLAGVLGAILAMEVTKNPAGWHPHFHCIVMLPRSHRVEVVDLRSAWTKETRGRQIKLSRIYSDKDLREVFKYSVKPEDLTQNGQVNAMAVQDRYHAYQVLKGKRLIRGYGAFHGVKDIVDLNAEEELTDGELGDSIDLFFRWSGSNYEAVPGEGLEIKNGKVKRGNYVL
jgi:hypothetical protein